MPEIRPHIGYVLKKYPRLSETFILNEILGVEAHDADVSIYSLNMPDDGRFHADLARVRAGVEYLPPFGSRSVEDAFRAIAPALSLRPGALATALCFLDRLPDEKKVNVLVHALLVARRTAEKKIDHLHAHFMTVAAHVAYIAHLFSGTPFSITAHAKDIYRDTVNALNFAEVARASAAVVTVSEANRRYIADTFLGGSDDKVRLVYNGLPLDEIRPDQTRREKDLIIGVGRFVEKKGFVHFLESLAELVRAGERVRGVLIGDGEERAALERCAKRLELGDAITFTGALPREETFRWMRRARVLVAPCVTGADGNQDALPTVLLEALALELPVVATPVGGIREIADHERHGLIVPEGDTSALTAAVRRLLKDDALWSACSKAGPVRAYERFDRKNTVPKLLDLFRTAISDAREKASRR